MVGVHVNIASSAIGIKICAITAGMKKYKSIIKKKRKKDDKIALPINIILNTIKVLIFKVAMKPYINHDEFVSVNNVLREYNEMREEVKNSENTVEYSI